MVKNAKTCAWFKMDQEELKHVSSAVAANPIGRPRVRTITVKATPIRDLLPLLWHDDYWLLIDQLLEQHPALVELLQGYLNITASRYKDRLDDQPLVRYLQAQKFKIATIVQTLVTTGHQLRGTHILKMAKSIVSLRQRLERKRFSFFALHSIQQSSFCASSISRA